MKLVTNFPIYNGCLGVHGSMAELASDCAEAGIDGIEAIWDWATYTDEMPPSDLVVGHHVTFWSCWVDFWMQDEEALSREFGSRRLVRDYYMGDTRQAIVDTYLRDIGHAMETDAEYLVFHVSDVNLEECYTYDFVHTDDQVLDCAIELANAITPAITNGAAFLVENQWWPGFTFTDPRVTQKLLDGIEYENKGIVLDIGHLMNTNTSLRTEEDGARYVSEMLDRHGELSKMVRALHLHKSLSGRYVEKRGYRIPEELLVPPENDEEFWDRYSTCYSHILKIDRHQPWTSPSIVPIIERIDPEWINNELSAPWRKGHMGALKTQMRTLALGGLFG